MDGADLCFEIVKRADAGFVYSEAVGRYVAIPPQISLSDKLLYSLEHFLSIYLSHHSQPLHASDIRSTALLP